jgi:hypothetical protein
MLERDIEQKLVALAGQLRIYTRKFTSPQRRGVPDRIFVCGAPCADAPHSVTFYLELKRPGETPTGLQRHELQELSGQGARAAWTDSYEQGAHALRMMSLFRGDPAGFSRWFSTHTDPSDDWRLC